MNTHASGVIKYSMRVDGKDSTAHTFMAGGTAQQDGIQIMLSHIAGVVTNILDQTPLSLISSLEIILEKQDTTGSCSDITKQRNISGQS